MLKIKKLPLHEIQKIAAGEVVERPANVVKELIENSLDAGAMRITIVIEEGGKNLIRVIDNGCGMTPDDARMSIVHHATSKITGISDLESSTTYGFRGEALSAIISVSHCTITTKETSSLEGTRLTLHDGSILREEIVACQPGTDIIVKNLFYNVPARRKFLKTTATEWRALLTLVQAYCLAYPSCHITLQHDDTIILNCVPTDSPKTRFDQLFTLSTTPTILTCSFGNTSTSASLSGLISDPQYTRYDRSMFFLFVNKRWIKNTKLGHAIMQGYGKVLPPGKFPIACIFIEIDQHSIDINIHPRKEEVQFLHPHKIEHALKTMIADRLNEYRSDQLGPPSKATYPQSHRSAALPTFSNAYETSPIDPGYQSLQTVKNFTVDTKDFIDIIEKKLVARQETTSAFDTSRTAQAQVDATNDEQQPIMYNYHLIGQLHATYILLETDQGLVIIDQHAAHERILYEQFIERFTNIPRIALIFPHIMTVSQRDRSILLQYIDLFTQHGIIMDQKGEHQFVISELPVHAKEYNIEEFIHAIIGWIHELNNMDGSTFFKNIHERIRTQMACKAAIKAGDTLSIAQMHELITHLNITNNRLTCPHGRPTSWLLALSDIERTFKRKR